MSKIVIDYEDLGEPGIYVHTTPLGQAYALHVLRSLREQALAAGWREGADPKTLSPKALALHQEAAYREELLQAAAQAESHPWKEVKTAVFECREPVWMDYLLVQKAGQLPTEDAALPFRMAYQRLSPKAASGWTGEPEGALLHSLMLECWILVMKQDPGIESALASGMNAALA
jgi:hypothetical protein